MSPSWAPAAEKLQMIARSGVGRLRPVVALIILAMCTLTCHANDIDWQWHEGRATHYGNLADPWTIHYGGCQYGYLDKDKATGWDIAAVSDKNWAYAGQCGVCFEVACVGTDVIDGYGELFDRKSVCKHGTDKSVVVQVTDYCPCDYPDNAYSNKRWCCGDTFHLDLSVWAFEKLADPKWGVINLQWRRVPCDYKPDTPAPALQDPSPGYGRPNGWQPQDDKRPWV